VTIFLFLSDKKGISGDRLSKLVGDYDRRKDDRPRFQVKSFEKGETLPLCEGRSSRKKYESCHMTAILEKSRWLKKKEVTKEGHQTKLENNK